MLQVESLRILMVETVVRVHGRAHRFLPRRAALGSTRPLPPGQVSAQLMMITYSCTCG